MTVTAFPAPSVNGGQLTLIDYSRMAAWWSGSGPLTLPFGDPLEATTLGGDWTVKAGTAIIRGHLFINDAAVTQPFTSNTDPSPRYDWVVAQIDHAQGDLAPQILAVEGSPGGGNPSLQRDENGLWQEPLGLFEITDTGASNFAGEARVFPVPAPVFGLFRDSVISPQPEQRHFHYNEQRWYRWDGTGWVKDQYDSGFVVINPTGHWVQSNNPPLRIRRVNDLVILKGSWNRGPDFAYLVEGGYDQFGSIPAEFRPPEQVEHVLVNARMDNHQMQCLIEPNGNLFLDLDGLDLPANTKITFNMSWFV